MAGPDMGAERPGRDWAAASPQGAGRRGEQAEAEDRAAMGVHAPRRRPHRGLGGEADPAQPRHGLARSAGLREGGEPGLQRRRARPEGRGIHVRMAAAVDEADEAGLGVGVEFKAQSRDRGGGDGFGVGVGTATRSLSRSGEGWGEG